MIGRLKFKLLSLCSQNTFPNLQRSVIELNQISDLCNIFGWKNLPVLDDPTLYEFSYLEDVNQRRIRDAESIATVMCNSNPRIALEIGTAEGHGTALMAINAPKARVFTVNIPPEEIISGEGGILTTAAFEKDKIGAYYRERGLNNITQIFANTATWEPDIGDIDVAFIDGCHDADFVYNDTVKILRHMSPGSYILWHDFNLDLAEKYNWIHSVCSGVERLYQNGLLNGRIFHLRDSWVGIYKRSL